ncbi:MAG: nucleoside triphosphate pyrophosphohydrolase [Bacillota bacterium]
MSLNEPVLIIVGLGPGDPGIVPDRNWRAIQKADLVLLRTCHHPSVMELEQRGIRYEALDRFYEEGKTFEEVYHLIVNYVIKEALKRLPAGRQVVYAVPGHPQVAETTVKWLLEKARAAGIPFAVCPAMSCLDAVYAALELDPAGGLVILDAMELEGQPLVTKFGLLVTQVYNRAIASEVKLTLMDSYPDEHLVIVVRGAGIPDGEKVRELPLYEVDRLEWIDYLTTLYVPPLDNTPSTLPGGCGCRFPLDPLVELMDTLRGDNGCPWDRQQTHMSLKKYLLEEAYEVAEAIESGEMHNLCEELGDLLLQVVFHAKLASESQQFDMNDIIRGITDKMVRRHPHVFGEAKADTPAQVKVNWDKIKAAEKKQAGIAVKTGSLMDIPLAMPALMRAEKVQRAAAKVGFDWPDPSGAWDKVAEELREVQEAVREEDQQKIKEEIGDLIFGIVNVARLLRVNAEDALDQAVKKFARRFRYIEALAGHERRQLAAMTLAELDSWWEEAKKNE